MLGQPTCIVVGESEDLREVLSNKYDVDVRKLKHQLSVIAAKVRQNKIGFARLLIDGTPRHLVVLPKLHGVPELETKASGAAELLYSYLAELERLSQRYPREASVCGVHRVGATTRLQLSEGSPQEGVHKLDLFANRRLLESLERVRVFFLQNRPQRERTVRFSSHAIESTLDIAACLTDPVKSNLHQFKAVSAPDNRLAELTLSAIESLFDKQPAPHQTVLHLAKEAVRVIGTRPGLRSKVSTETRLRLSQERRLFTGATRGQLLVDLMTLCGAQDANDFPLSSLPPVHANQLLGSFDSYFFEVNRLYELMVWEALEASRGECSLEFHPDAKSYWFTVAEDDSSLPKNANERDRRSEPDFLVSFQGKPLAVGDAKWRILDGMPDEDELSKLCRDAKHRGSSKGILFYPSINGQHSRFNKDGKPLALRRPDLGDFEFYVIELAPVFIRTSALCPDLGAWLVQS